jgi:hypothetical protein
VADETPAACEARLRGFSEFVKALPERAVNAAIRADLPESTLGAVPGTAPVIEISEAALVIDGEPSSATSLSERAAALNAWALRTPGSDARVVYVAPARETDVRTLRAYLAALPARFEARLLVGTVQESAPPGVDGGRAEELARGLLSARDPAARQAIAKVGYAEFSSCAAFDRAVAGVEHLSSATRWSALRAAVASALPRCSCGELDSHGLERVLAAEQRAGASTLGVLPLEFLRDQRCGASMPLRSIGKLVQQMERFDVEFAGQFQDDRVEFDDVLANERLLTYFCDALPGETLAAEQRARATLYLRRDGAACEGWRFEPLSPGAPMGTFRRVSGPNPAPLAVHYWQATEELRLFGPVSGDASKPTDQRSWPCDQTTKLTAVDARSIELEAGRWFSDEASCQRAPAEPPRAPGCFSTLGNEPAATTESPR